MVTIALILSSLLFVSGCAGFHPVKMTTDPGQQQQERSEQMNQEANDAAMQVEKSFDGEPAPSPVPTRR